MLQLPNGCTCSELSVYPNNWDKSGASVKKDWYIQYYFYDPSFKDTKKYPLLKIVKGGINTFKTLAERRRAVSIVMEEHKYLLEHLGYNPILKKCISPVRTEYEVDPNTRFIDALKSAAGKLKLVDSTKSDLNSIIRGVEKAATDLRFTTLPISQIRRKHIKSILEHIGNTNPKFSANRFNKYRSYLLMLFKELEELEATDVDPITKISKQKIVHKMRELLTPEQRIMIDKYLKEKKHDRKYLF